MLDERTVKPRQSGITMVIDTGFGVETINDIVQHYGHLIDHWKLGFGTTVAVSRDYLQQKLALLSEANILAYPGGTLLEVALLEHHCRVYMKRAKELGFRAVEVSDGTLTIPKFRRKNIIHCVQDAGLIAITEVGKKDPRRQPTTEQLIEEILQDLDWGARWVIVEGRESGVGIGVFDKHGVVAQDEVDAIANAVGDRMQQVIWEAPLKNQQAVLIEKFGSNVSLGNICPTQVLAIEALRCGLRFETLQSVSNQRLRSGAWNPNQTEPNPDD
jgi:phosphosulfolactate synthase